jgi:uncharacterized coiled-coil protein SlyX
MGGIIGSIVTQTKSSSDSTRIASRDRRIAELEAQLRERDAAVAELEAQLRQRDAVIGALQEQVRQLQEQMDEVKQAGKRQATPFARKKRVAQAKRPGRKKGQGKFSCRRKPVPGEVSETEEAPLACCPECGGSLTERKEHEQFVVDIPPV